MNMPELLHNCGTIVRNEWVKLITAENVVDLGRYRDGIILSDAFVGANTGEIKVVATAPHSIYLEKGHVAFNLAQKIDPAKWRVGKKGNRYIRIPFRHYTPIKDPSKGYSKTRRRQAMPADIYAAAKKLGDYKQTRDRLKLSVTGGNPKYQGMFRNISDYRGSGKSVKQSSFHTIRTITPQSKWIIPATKPGNYAKRTAQTAQPLVAKYVAGVAAASVRRSIINAAVTILGK